jgi:hypothetical protein
MYWKTAAITTLLLFASPFQAVADPIVYTETFSFGEGQSGWYIGQEFLSHRTEARILFDLSGTGGQNIAKLVDTVTGTVIDTE